MSTTRSRSLSGDASAVTDQSLSPTSPTVNVEAPGTTATAEENASTVIDCAICLEPAVFPVELPCRHAFCYLCLKGTALQATHQGQGPRCSICRSNIPLHILSNPPLKDSGALQRETPPDAYQWYYECRSGGWWQFEERQNIELERASEAKEPKCNLLIAGQVYEIDFQEMIQYRPSTRHIIRRIKRDLASTQKKGIAGIRINSAPSPSQSQGSASQPTDSSSGTGTNLAPILDTTSATATALLGATALRAIASGNLVAETNEAEFNDSYDESEDDNSDDYDDDSDEESNFELELFADDSSSDAVDNVQNAVMAVTAAGALGVVPGESSAAIAENTSGATSSLGGTTSDMRGTGAGATAEDTYSYVYRSGCIGEGPLRSERGVEPPSVTDEFQDAEMILAPADLNDGVSNAFLTLQDAGNNSMIGLAANSFGVDWEPYPPVVGNTFQEEVMDIDD